MLDLCDPFTEYVRCPVRGMKSVPFSLGSVTEVVCCDSNGGKGATAIKCGISGVFVLSLGFRFPRLSFTGIVRSGKSQEPCMV